jgi:hypothetical protein
MKTLKHSTPVIALAFVAACTATSPMPTSPSAAVDSSTAVTGPGGSTLKTTPPALIDPIDGVKVDDVRPTLVWSNANAKYGGIGVAYDLEIENSTANVYSRTVGETPEIGAHLIDYQLEFDRQYYWRVRARVGNEFGPWSSWAMFTSPSKPVVAAPTPTTSGGATPNGGCAAPISPLGAGETRKPRPNDSSIPISIAINYPAAFRNSCQESGGTWEFMDRSVDALRQKDGRYGYNAKRGNVNDPSLDVISYYYGGGNDIQGQSQVWIIDLIGGHCGSNPTNVWNDVTDITISSGTLGRTIYPRPGRNVAACTTTP